MTDYYTKAVKMNVDAYQRRFIDSKLFDIAGKCFQRMWQLWQETQFSFSIQSTLSKTDTFGTGPDRPLERMSLLSISERCPAYRDLR